MTPSGRMPACCKGAGGSEGEAWKGMLASFQVSCSGTRVLHAQVGQFLH